MTDNTQPEALRLADEVDEVARTYPDMAEVSAELRRQHARIAELEAQLASIRADGVSGPLMGQPQAVPDLSQLTERGAKAWAGVDAQGLRDGRWYMVTHDGVATLCEDRRDAEKEAKDADMAWPHSGPHRAVQLAEASTAGFTAADMATAEARGFRDGAASAMAGEPMAWMTFTEEGDPDMVFLDRLEACQYCEDDDPPKPLYIAAPPTAQAEGWTKLPGQLPEPGMPVLLDIGKKYPIRAMWAAKHTVQAADDDTDWGEYVEADDMYYAPEGWYEWNQCEDNHWRVTETPRAWMPLPPTSAEGVEHG